MKWNVVLYILPLLLNMRCMPPTPQPPCPLTDLTISEEAVHQIREKYAIPEHDLRLSSEGTIVEYRFKGKVFQIDSEVTTTQLRNLDDPVNRLITLYRDDACDELAQIEFDTFLSVREKAAARRLVKADYIDKCIRVIQGRTEPSQGDAAQHSCDLVRQEYSSRDVLQLAIAPYLGVDGLLKLHFEPADPRAAGVGMANYGVERFFRLNDPSLTLVDVTRNGLSEQLKRLDLIVTAYLTKAGSEQKLCSFEWRYS